MEIMKKMKRWDNRVNRKGHKSSSGDNVIFLKQLRHAIVITVAISFGLIFKENGNNGYEPNEK